MIQIRNLHVKAPDVKSPSETGKAGAASQKATGASSLAGKTVSSLIERLNPGAGGAGASFSPARAIHLSMIFSAVQQNLWKTVLESLEACQHPDAQQTGLKAVAKDMLIQRPAAATGETLKQLVDASGLCWEAKLRKHILQHPFLKEHLEKLIAHDLKGAASRLVAQSESSDDLMSGLVTTIKSFQLLNLYAWEKDGKLFLPLPFLLPDGTGSVGELLIQLPKEKAGRRNSREPGDNRFCVTFLLELSSLGPLRVDLKVTQAQIEGSFWVTQASFRQRIEAALPELEDKLAAKGFHIKRLECLLKEPSAVKQSLVLSMLPEEAHSISFVV